MRAITIINTRALPDSGGPVADARLDRMGHLLKTPDKHIFPQTVSSFLDLLTFWPRNLPAAELQCD